MLTDSVTTMYKYMNITDRPHIQNIVKEKIEKLSWRKKNGGGRCCKKIVKSKNWKIKILKYWNIEKSNRKWATIRGVDEKKSLVSAQGGKISCAVKNELL